MTKKILIFTASLFLTIGVCAQVLYSKSYGNSTNPAMIFLHGGPGYNSVDFEISTAQKLANKGYYVIVYDRRGCARSKALGNNATYTFNEADSDLLSIYEKYHLKKATLLGHSFGGTIGIKFIEKYPDKVDALVLISAPIEFSLTFKSIITKAAAVYKKRNDTTNLRYIGMLEKMDSSKLEYSSYCFMDAMYAGLYRPKFITAEADTLYKEMGRDSLSKYLVENDYPPVKGFYASEAYTTLNLTQELKKIIKEKVNVYGIYGDDDGLFEQKQLNDIKSIIGDKNFHLVSDASHGVFVDQQSSFLKIVSAIK